MGGKRAALRAGVAILALLAPAAPLLAEDGPPKGAPLDERLERVERELERTRAEVEALRRERETRPPAPAEPPEPAGEGLPKDLGDRAFVTFKDGFDLIYVDSDGDPAAEPADRVLHRLGVHGLLHADFRGLLEPDYPTGDQFLLRRARLTVVGTLYRHHQFQVEVDGGGFSTGVRDAHLTFAYLDAARVRVGAQKVPFSFELLASARFLPFVEFSLFNLATSGLQRDIGVQVLGDLGPVAYQVGVFNGSGIGRADDNDDKDVALRLSLAPFRDDEGSALRGLSLGGAFTIGHQSRAPQDFPTYAGTTYVDFLPATSMSGVRYRLGAEAGFSAGPWNAVAELFHLRLEDLEAPGAKRSAGVESFYIGLSYMLTGEDFPLAKRVRPRRDFDPFAGGTGAVAVVARFDTLHIDHGIFSSGIASGTNHLDALTLGARWFLNAFLKVEADFYHAWFDDDVAGEDDEWGVNARFALTF